MRTARVLTVSRQRDVLNHGGVLSHRGVVYLVTGGVLSHRGVYLVTGGVLSQVLSPLLWTEFLTHASENITLPQTSFAGGKNVLFIIGRC